MPSVALACYAHGRPEQGFDYLKRQAVAARKAGSFHEYWTWEKYAGKTEPGGAPWYGETSAGFLDVLIHGLFGLSSPEPGFRSIRLAPQFPMEWKRAALELRLPNGARLTVRYRAHNGESSLAVVCEAPVPITVILPWHGPGTPVLTGRQLTGNQVEKTGKAVTVIAQMQGKGTIVMTPAPIRHPPVALATVRQAR